MSLYSAVMMSLDVYPGAAAYRPKLESSSIESLGVDGHRCLTLARFFAERTNIGSIWLSLYVPEDTPGAEHYPAREYGSGLVIPPSAILRWRWERPQKPARVRARKSREVTP